MSSQPASLDRILGLILLVACCVHAADASEPAGSGERDRKRDLRVDAIVLPDNPARVESTAAAILQKALRRHGIELPTVAESQRNSRAAIRLGTKRNARAIAQAVHRGEIRINERQERGDAYHLKRVGDDILVAGANPRGVLAAAFALEGILDAGTAESIDRVSTTPATGDRIAKLPFFLMSDHPGEQREFSARDAEYFARLGVNAVLDGGGGSWDLSRFVHSDVFPFQAAPDAELKERIARSSALLEDYGIDYHIMLWEPLLPRYAAPVESYPASAIGTVKRPWGGDENGHDRTLCVSDPTVQSHYAGLIRKFVREFRDVDGFLFYNLDGKSWLCTPGLCPRCAAICTDSPRDTAHPWETQARFTDLLAKAARDTRSDFQFIHWISHFHDDAAEKLIEASHEFSALAFGVKNGDHDAMIADVITPAGSEFAMLQRAAAEKGRRFYAIYAANAHEVVPNGFQYPFTVAESIRRLHSWGIQHYMGTAPLPYFNQVNALVEREFLRDPSQDPDHVIADIAKRQFGDASGALMLQAWREIHDGMKQWRDLRLHPFCGSQTHVSVGFSYFTKARALLPDSMADYENSLQILTNVEPFHAPDYEKFRQPLFLEKFRAMALGFARADEFARQAIDLAPATEGIGISAYEPQTPPSKRQFAELNRGAIAIAATYARLRTNFLQVYQLHRRHGGDHARWSQSARADYRRLLATDVQDRRRFIETLNAFSAMKPCITRTSLSEKGITAQIEYMTREIELTEAFLATLR